MTRNWQQSRVLIIGAARQGQALARYLASHGASIWLNDSKPASEMEEAITNLSDLNIEWILGDHSPEILSQIDLLFLSGGVSPELPLVQEAIRRGIPLSNDTQLLFETCPCPIIGITGSAGKTTTTTLVGRIAQAATGLPGMPARAWVGGNIGNPLITQVEEISPADLVILELSSFQLELTTCSPQIAAVLNITPNHLDRHRTMQAYTAAKARILEHQSSSSITILNREDNGSWSLAPRVRGTLFSFGIIKPHNLNNAAYVDNGIITIHTGEETIPLLSIDEISLRGAHNLRNCIAAATIAYASGLPDSAIRDGIRGFAGVPHRLEYIRTLRGAAWYNDSIATAPERSIAAIQSFTEPLILLAGGRDKNLPWETWAALVCQRVDHLILFGEAAPLIASAIQSVSGNRPFTVHTCQSLEQAVQHAAQITAEGDVVLLSPGGTSFDEFRDFEERGERFVQWVNKLT